MPKPLAPQRKARRKRDFIKVGNVKIGWTRFGDGRTCLDLRKWRQENARPTYVDHAEALKEARKFAIELNAGGRESQALTAEDRAHYAQAVTAARIAGADLPTMVSEWREARRLIALEPVHARPTLLESVKAGIAALRRPEHLTGDIALQLLLSKGKQDLDGRHLRDLRYYLLGRVCAPTDGAGAQSPLPLKWKPAPPGFAAAYPGDIAAITPQQIEHWLDGLRKRNAEPLSDSRRNHAHDAIIQLFRYARTREYLPDRITAAQKVQPIKTHAKEVDVFTPAEMQAILDTVEEAWLPYFAIVAFSGVRVEEVSKSYHSAKRKDSLRWEDFDWPEREIVIRSTVAKTGQHRRVPIFNNLWEFLGPWRDRGAKGYVIAGSIDRFRQRFKRQLLGARIGEAARCAGVNLSEFERLEPKDQAPHLAASTVTDRLIGRWSNQLRHSYGTYRMALLKRNKHQVAAEMGNSPGIVVKHYDNRCPGSHGDAWFNIFPSVPSNVTQLHLALIRA